MIAVGESLDRALALAVEVETLAEMYWRALQIREPEVLSDAEMQTVLAKFADYGKKATQTGASRATRRTARNQPARKQPLRMRFPHGARLAFAADRCSRTAELRRRTACDRFGQRYVVGWRLQHSRRQPLRGRRLPAAAR
jgi:hypothetical protein